MLEEIPLIGGRGREGRKRERERERARDVLYPITLCIQGESNASG